ncbi:hypothetical protein AA0117_g82 [Alternaria alternata]|uniref:Uncharacterized protein n=1 Tax=Alternaria alternata TaxID=5599 RepID=A0A4Q4NW24_ALTAL|nr:hypothetical protein AA0117_g82 [Alternaria alternata]
MSRTQRHSGGSAGGSRRNGGAEGRESYRGDSHGNHTTSTSTSRNHAYDPSRDSIYTQAPRPSRSDHAHLTQVTNNSALNTPPPPAHPQNLPYRPYNAQHQFLTNHSSSHLRISPYDPYGRDFNASQAFQTTSPAGVFAQPDRQPYYPATGGSRQDQAADRYADPYNTVGHIRRDGAVYDQEEEYEEYRPYGSNVHQHGQRGYYGSNDTSR